MKDDIFHIGLIGCGAITQNFYTPALKALEHSHKYNVKFIADLNISSLEKTKKIFFNAKTVQSLEEIPAHSIDLAIIASPPHFHCLHSLHLLDKGIHILCEKPMAVDYAQSYKMVSKAKEKNLILHVGLVRRFFPAVATIDFLIKNQTFGKVTRFSFFEGQYFSWPICSPSIFQKTSNSQGVFHDLGVHGLDLILKWFGKPLAYSYKDNQISGVPTTVDIHFEFLNNIQGHFLVSWNTPLRNTCLIECEHATIEWPLGSTSQVHITPHGLPFVLKADIAHNLATHPLERISKFSNDFSSSFIDQLTFVKNLILGRVSPKISLEEALDLAYCMDIIPKNQPIA